MANVKTFILLATAAVLTSAHSRGGGGGTSAPKVLQKATVVTKAPQIVPSKVFISTPSPPGASTLSSSYSYSSSPCCRSLSAAERAFDANTDLLAVNWTTFGRSMCGKALLRLN